MKKSERISAGLSSTHEAAIRHGAEHPCYTGFFDCFNAGKYFEAHDVLEHLWLQCADANRHFYKGLIQIAGAFVHLQKNRLRPNHPKDAGRLRPAVRLFQLGTKNLAPYRPYHLRLDVESLCARCENLAEQITDTDFQVNPWHANHPLLLHLT